MCFINEIARMTFEYVKQILIDLVFFTFPFEAQKYTLYKKMYTDFFVYISNHNMKNKRINK